MFLLPRFGPQAWIPLKLPDGPFLPQIVQHSLTHYGPLGHKYYYSPVYRIVTTANIEEEAVNAAIIEGYTTLMARKNSDMLRPNSLEANEIFLEVDCLLNPSMIRYYIVDRACKRLSWLEDSSSNETVPLPVSSELCLGKINLISIQILDS